jgi:hypothetical protein
MEALGSGNTGTKKRVAYFYDAEIGNYHYGQGHPMKVSFMFATRRKRNITWHDIIIRAINRTPLYLAIFLFPIPLQLFL